MIVRVHARHLKGHIRLPSSKSLIHRALFAAALCSEPTRIVTDTPARRADDIKETLRALSAFGSRIEEKPDGLILTPFPKKSAPYTVDIKASATTWRFLMPIAARFRTPCTIHASAELFARSAAPYARVFESNGVRMRSINNTIRLEGQLSPGQYHLDAGLSSQFVSGMLFVMPFLEPSKLMVDNKVSAPYIAMTEYVLSLFGIHYSNGSAYGQYHTPGVYIPEWDASAAAFFEIAKAWGHDITFDGVPASLCQGDAALPPLDPLPEKLSLKDQPDLFPILALYATQAPYPVCFTDIERLRYKETDRIAATTTMLAQLGAASRTEAASVCIYPSPLHGGTVDSRHDHRIAMTAAIASLLTEDPITILNAEAVSKSYPGFFEDFIHLGGSCHVITTR